MADHLSDEEQLEALKKWWKSNGTSLVLTIALAAGGLFGWNYWQDAQQRKAEESSVVYMAMMEAMNAWELDGSAENAAVVASHAETLKKLGDNNRYGLYAAMIIARLAATDDDLDNAAAELNWVLQNSKEDALSGLARLRLAIIEYSRQNPEQALSLLNTPYPESYKALYEELKGDIFVSTGDNENASTAYRVALDSLDESQTRARAMVELKMNELMPTAQQSAAIKKEDA